MEGSERVTLKRSVSLWLLTLYGVGTIVGGGFYALVGKVSDAAGVHAPVSMLLAAALATLTGLCYAELASRFPSSAGTPHYVYEAFRSDRLSIATGWLVIATGVVSAATLVIAFEGFLSDLVTVPRTPVVVFACVALCAVAAWGISESIAVAVTITLLEVGGLLYVLSAAGSSVIDAPGDALQTFAPSGVDSWLGVGLGAFVIFYAFIGFEDMVTLAEEVRDPRRNMPLAIVFALAVTALLYVSVSLVSVRALPQDVLIESNTPIAELVAHHGSSGRVTITVISMFAGVNGALVQIIMAARILYGMAQQDLAPAWMGTINPTTRTPVKATVFVGAVCVVLTLGLPLLTLAKVTSGIILLTFVLVNASLLVVKRRTGDAAEARLSLPQWVPAAGTIACALLLGMQVWQTLT